MEIWRALSLTGCITMVSLGMACASGSTLDDGLGVGGSGGENGTATHGSTHAATTGVTSTVASTTIATTVNTVTSTSITTATTTVATTVNTSVTVGSTTSGMMPCNPIFEVTCGDGTCVGFIFWCDGSNECADGADESTALCGSSTSWTCDSSYYGAGDGCDCGCGEVDPDCLDPTAGSCDYCGETGSCALTDCSNLDPANNGTCI